MSNFLPKININVIGIGGGGCAAIDRLNDNGMKDVHSVAIDTDSQDLLNSQAGKRIYVGKNVTSGMGTGKNPTLGRASARENKNLIADQLKISTNGPNISFIVACMGGGSGTGMAPIIAEISKRRNDLVIGIVTKPFWFEGAGSIKIAERGIRKLEKEVDALIVISNDQLFNLINPGSSIKATFSVADQIIEKLIKGISDLVVKPGIVNIDFSDIKSIMENSGLALMGIGEGVGDERAKKAATAAVSNPLSDYSIQGASGILFNITGGEDLSLMDIEEVAKIITKSAHQEAKIIFGAVKDPYFRNKIRVTVIATGLNFDNKEVKKYNAKTIKV